MVDLNAIKEQVQTILETNNTTTSSVVDLSGNLTNRVSGILKLNPLRVFTQSTQLPIVTTWIDSKDVTQQGSLKNQSTAKKIATVNVKIAGIVNNNSILSTDNDEADEDLQYLMENIEEIIRSNDTLNATVDWSLTQGVTYEDAPISEDTIYRVGILDLEARVLY